MRKAITATITAKMLTTICIF